MANPKLVENRVQLVPDSTGKDKNLRDVAVDTVM